MTCLFCSIGEKKIPSDIVYEDDNFLAFRDISPAAPVHILLIPKKHIKSLEEVAQDDLQLMAEIFPLIQKIAAQEGLSQAGYRLVANAGAHGGQTVDHLHFHILGGRELQWPPG